MGTLHHVLHTGARPIGLSEFVDAVRATCPPRFTHQGSTQPRRVALAISGGVDSMALASLCSRVRKFAPKFQVSDNPVSGFRGMVVDHRLREGSFEEANAVCKTLQDMGFLADVIQINWSRVLGNYSHPKELPNFESVARALRYERLGYMCGYRKLASLFLAHHEDDQYETVLMRLLQGHGSRGLRGMKKAHDIPECDGMFGVHQSGYVDDQMSEWPFYRDTPSAKVRKHLREAIKADFRSMDNQDPEAEAESESEVEVELEDFYHKTQYASIEPNDIRIEDGGVMVYRPLLEFSKDRLVATCLENNVPWWEDSTNQDATLTMRNAVRKLYKGYTLPKALQKPSILALSKRCERRVQALEAEADRLLRQTIIHDFELHAGTAIVQFPKYESAITRRDSRSPLRRKARLSRRREIAAIVLRKILMLVSPEKQAPHIPTLENHVWRLFPSLADPGNAAQAGEPKAFSLCGVLLAPITPEFPQGSSAAASAANASNERHMQQLTWHLSRAHYPSTQPVPRVRTPYWAMINHTPTFLQSSRAQWMLWDGRYWCHAEHRFPYRVIVQPFLAAHSKPFRALLSPTTRALLDARLKRYAPGKVRYTLPGLYLEEDLDLSRPMRDVAPRRGYPDPIAWEYVKGGGAGDDGRGADRGVAQEGERRDQSEHPRVPDSSKMKLLALPTLGIQIPGLDEWIEYEVRYRKADREILGLAGSWDRGSFGAFGPLGKKRGRVMRVKRRVRIKARRKGKKVSRLRT
ncbi:adenine nucleotide alpha hydrolases-like protein [Annulohypoxylon truncatum]|uniref:adenine nucleotide alpha hydrolases-like protein n=1 Tax=Annulohypoxylon truncatum TaxID=327061 RepID=UPI0020076235|nr:adenine nucleotide alpha hydrolases-like protein [Annulohypoxylon truncatum]KAI1210515.1 adenine nucleotide alpha hydrolases-like protein [Annulohypoxylon truncatum]